MENPMTYFWLVVIIISLIVEVSTASLVAIWFIPSAILSIILSLFNVSIGIQVTVFFVISIISLLALRKIIYEKLKKQTVPTNADALIGKTGIVIEDIDYINLKGQVKVSGQVWTAIGEGEKIIKGDTVEIIRIEGVKLVIKKIKSEVTL